VASALALAVFEQRGVTDAPPPEFRQPIPVDLADNHLVAGLGPCSSGGRVVIPIIVLAAAWCRRRGGTAAARRCAM
jgi:hypothetical protein